MTRDVDTEFIERLRAESEATREAEYPEGSKAVRPNRSRVYSVRLSADEQARVESLAREKHLPASTLVRSWILERIEQERSA
ncbi:DUF6290 family protein [Nakamurella aerolata]|uniref:DUF6290 family protein n=1 Tax=Nakamurella aerolata TaxID=1656892 RepID=UPI0031B5D139